MGLRLLITAALCALGPTGLPAWGAPFCRVVAPPGSPALVRQAAAELSGYLERLTGSEIPVVARRVPDAPSILLRVTPGAKELGEEGYRLEPGGRGRSATLTIRGRTPLAVQHGAYRLLREYGIGFYFDGDAIPTQPPSRFLLPRIQASPVFRVRGSLPWYNFLDSPTTWDDQDFRFLADQLLRSGQNFVGFHTYDHEPFAAYRYGGKLIGGEPLMTTEQSIWGTHPMPVDDFGFGTARYFPGRYWGGDEARKTTSREARIAAQKALLARGLAYASARGIRTCLGFEVSGDPSDPEEQRHFRARLTQLLRDYPMLDYVWLWQPEARSLEGTQPPALRSQGGRLFREWRKAFSYLRSPAREWEGMRVAGYARLARRLMDGTAPSVKLVLSGWGGDNHLHVSDYFPAWDKVLDRRIIFAALDDIVVHPKVSRYYRLPATRERWAIPWYEYDGDQWFPQANAHVFDQTVRDARAKGCQGLLAIHWRTKEVGESQALVARYAWQPEQTLASFYRDYGVRRAGPKAGPELGRLLQTLDEMGYRWLGGPGQVECGTFGWCHVPDAARQEKLKALRARLQTLYGSLAGQRVPTGAAGRVWDVIATIDRGLIFNQVAGLLVEGGPVDRALAMADGPAREAECARLLDQLAPASGHTPFAEMLRLWGETITSRGELGVLATINAKAFADYRARVGRLREACGRPAAIRDLSAADGRHRELVSDYQQTTLPAGSPLTVRCVAFEGSRPARGVTLEYQVQGTRGWAIRTMKRLERCVFQATLPTPARGSGWVRYRIRARVSEGDLVWPGTRGEAWRQVHLLQKTDLVSRHNRLVRTRLEGPSPSPLQARGSAQGTVRLSWSARTPLVEVAVDRRTEGSAWQALGETLDCVWEDTAAPRSGRLEYRLRDASGRQLAACAVDAPSARTPARPTQVQAVPRGRAIRLRWSGGDLAARTFSVERAWDRNGPFTTISPAEGVTPGDYAGCVFVDRPGRQGAVYYRVRAHGFGPGQTAVSDTVSAQAASEVAAPALDLQLRESDLPAGLQFSGPHTFESEGGLPFLRTEGGFALPLEERLAVRGPFTVAVRFRMGERTPMPVLVCQGVWGGPGYFVQLLGSTLRFYVGGVGCLDRPVGIQPGEWHTVVAVYDGLSLSTYLDGTLLGEKASEGAFRPAGLPFAVARYSSIGPEWTFKGDVQFVRLYPQALEPEADLPGGTER